MRYKPIIILVSSLLLLVLISAAWVWMQPTTATRPLYGVFNQNTKARHEMLDMFLRLEESKAYQYVPGAKESLIGPVTRTTSTATVLDPRTHQTRYVIAWDGAQHMMTEYKETPPGSPSVPKVSYVVTPINNPLEQKVANARGAITVRIQCLWELAKSIFR